VLVWLDKFKPSKAVLVEPLFALGLALILVPIILYTDQIRFPGVTAFIPCFGAALLIFVAPVSKFKTLLANRAMVSVGLISYSLYLVHWPLYVFTRQVMGEITMPVTGVLILASIALAALSYRFVETPFRQQSSKPKLYKYIGSPLGYVLAAALVLGVSANARMSHGWKWRYSSEVNTLVDYKEDFRITNRMGGCYLNKKQGWRVMPRECYDSNIAKNGKKTYLILGSSYSADLWPGMAQIFKDENLLQLSIGGCLVRNGKPAKSDPVCDKFNQFVFEEVLPQHKYDLVIFSAGYGPTKLWSDTVKVLGADGQDFVVFGGRPRLNDLPATLVAAHGQREGVETMLSANIIPTNDKFWLDVIPPHQFFSVDKAICPTKTTCKWIVGEHLTYRDKSHFNTEGSVIVAEAFKEWLAKGRLAER